MGKQMNAKRIANLKAEYESGEFTMKELAEKYETSRTTVSKYLKDTEKPKGIMEELTTEEKEEFESKFSVQNVKKLTEIKPEKEEGTEKMGKEGGDKYEIKELEFEGEDEKNTPFEVEMGENYDDEGMEMEVLGKDEYDRKKEYEHMVDRMDELNKKHQIEDPTGIKDRLSKLVHDFKPMKPEEDSGMTEEEKIERRRLVRKIREYLDSRFSEIIAKKYIGSTEKAQEKFFRMLMSASNDELGEVLYEIQCLVSNQNTSKLVQTTYFSGVNVIEYVGTSFLGLNLEGLGKACGHTPEILDVLEEVRLKYSDLLHQYVSPEARLGIYTAQTILAVDSMNRMTSGLISFTQKPVDKTIEEEFADL